jgi:hypothetical protein
MQWRALKPRLIAWREVEINDGGETEGEIGAGNLRTIGGPKFWMSVDGVVIERRGVTRMDVRIDKSRNEKSPAPVYPQGMRTKSQVCADFSNPAIAKNNIGMKQRSDAFRRDQGNIFDYHALINNVLRVRRGPSIQNNKCSKCPRYQSIPQDRP